MGEQAAPAESAESAEPVEYGGIEGELLASYASGENLNVDDAQGCWDAQDSMEEESPQYGGKSFGKRPSLYSFKGSGEEPNELYHYASGKIHNRIHGQPSFVGGKTIDEVAESKVFESEGLDSRGELRERTNDGAVAIIAYQDPDSGEIKEYLLEENSASYALPEYAGKLRFIGGAIDKVNGKKEDPYTALERELYEEIPSREAANILFKYLDSETPYKTIKVDVDGEPTETHIFKIMVTDWNDWLIAVNANLGDDTGYSRLVTLDDILAIGKKGFAFDDFDVIHEFATGEMPKSAPKEPGTSHPSKNGHKGDEDEHAEDEEIHSPH